VPTGADRELKRGGIGPEFGQHIDRD